MFVFYNTNNNMIIDHVCQKCLGIKISTDHYCAIVSCFCIEKRINYEYNIKVYMRSLETICSDKKGSVL